MYLGALIVLGDARAHAGEAREACERHTQQGKENTPTTASTPIVGIGLARQSIAVRVEPVRVCRVTL